MRVVKCKGTATRGGGKGGKPHILFSFMNQAIV